MFTSHALTRYHGISIAPLATLYYFHPGLAAAVTSALATTTGIQEYLHRGKPTP